MTGKAGQETLNNAVVSKYAADKDAKRGAKSKHHVWFGYKRHNSADTRHGLIEKLGLVESSSADTLIKQMQAIEL